MNFSSLATLNAILNFTCFVLLFLGYRQIKAGNRVLHKKLMISAAITSVLFLASYLVYHWQVGSVKFHGEGWSRVVYFAILISHTILAAAVPPLVIVTLWRGLKGNYDNHKKIAKKTLPIWMYVSVTGVIVYLMLYHFF